ncbi:MAG: hypothetical protein H9533_21795 [Rhodobacteraceae bacterium]|jgi:hypothetical protein|nr:hypothetical protein [Paracoccaceae bacterium]
MSERDARRDRVRGLGAAKAALYIGGGLALATVFSKALDVFLTRLFEWNDIASALIAALLVGLVAWLFIYRKSDNLSRLLRSEARELDSNDLLPRPYLVTGHSLFTGDTHEKERALNALIETIRPDMIPDLCKPRDPQDNPLGPWQQGLRIMHFLHDTVGGPQAKGDRLRKVVVIDNGGTFKDAQGGPGTPQVAVFANMIRACFPDVEVLVVPEGADQKRTDLRVDRVYSIAPDYETYGYVTTAFDHAFERLERTDGGEREQVEAATYIDVTPGLKIFSIAAAVQTLNRRAVFLYVTSGDNRQKQDDRPEGYLILGYDADAQFDLVGSG